MADAAGTIPHLLFRLGDQHYALAIEQVIEVAAMVELVETPDIDDVFLGVANRHGAPLPVLDLRPVFRHPVPAVDTTTLFIVAHAAQQSAGLVVDEVLRIAHFDSSSLSQHVVRDRFVRSVVTHGDQMVQLLALSSLLAHYLPQAVSVHVEGEQTQ